MTELESDTNPLFDRHKPKPGIIIMLTLCAAFLGLQLIGPLAVLIIYFFSSYSGDFMSLLNALQKVTEHPELKMLMFSMQGAGACIGLILLPYLLRKWSQSDEKILAQPFYILPTTLVIVIVLVSMGLNSIFIEWNQNFKFPEAFGALEESLRSMEDQLNETSKYLTTFDSFTQALVAFFVIAVLAPIGEEFVFRGIVQKELFRSTKNAHLSIWLAAAIFSAFHLQFYGFLPRMFLGAMFGYIYYWSGSLILSILAHSVNNGFMIIVIYLHQQKVIEFDIETPESAPWQAVLFSAIFTVVLLYIFRKFYQQKKSNYISVTSPISKYNNLTQRIITGLAGSAGVITAVCFSEWTYFAVFFILALFTLLEFYKLVGLDGMLPLKTFGTICGLLIFTLSFLIEDKLVSYRYYFLIFPMISCVFVIKLYKKFERKPFTNIAITILGIFYVAVPISLLNIAAFENGEYNFEIIFGCLFILWASDTGAYFAGTFFGKRKLFERISPKKSWEGFFGGAALALIFTYGIAHYFHTLAFWQWAVVGVIIIVGGTLGDLVESLLKRSIEIKDSGDSLPGHGGFLDRFDGLLISAPFIVAFLEIF